MVDLLSDGKDAAVSFAQNYKLPTTMRFMGRSKLDTEAEHGNPLSWVDTRWRSSRRGVKQRAVRNDASMNQPKLLSAGPSFAVQGNFDVLERKLADELPKASASSAMNQGIEERAPDADWHVIPDARMTPELVRDLRVIENRKHLDPKRFYKASGTGRKKGELPSRVHMGTVVEAPHEFYSARIPKRERKRTVTEEAMADQGIVRFTKRRFKSLQQERSAKKRVIDPAAKRRRRNKRH